MYINCSKHCKRQGLTLIEVVTALAILSTLLVGILVAFKKNAERIRSELAVRKALAGVDDLLLSWAKTGAYPPIEGEGTLPGVDGFRWETRLTSRQYRDVLGVDIVTLRVCDDATVNRSIPIVAIELPVPSVEPLPEGAQP